MLPEVKGAQGKINGVIFPANRQKFSLVNDGGNACAPVCRPQAENGGVIDELKFLLYHGS